MVPSVNTWWISLLSAVPIWSIVSSSEIEYSRVTVLSTWQWTVYTVKTHLRDSMVGIDNKSVHIFKRVYICTNHNLPWVYVMSDRVIESVCRMIPSSNSESVFGCNKEMIIGLSLESITINLGYMLVTRNLRVSIFWPVEESRESIFDGSSCQSMIYPWSMFGGSHTHSHTFPDRFTGLATGEMRTHGHLSWLMFKFNLDSRTAGDKKITLGVNQCDWQRSKRH